MQAVIKTGGKQYLVEPNQTLEVDLVDSDAKNLTLDALMVIDGDKIQVGTPTVAGVSVVAEVIDTVKGEKIDVLKFKAKKRVSKKTGHRQRYLQIKIKSIGAAKAAKPKAEAVKKEPVAA